MTVTALSIAQRFIGTKEVPGIASNPLVLAMLRVDQAWPSSDAVPWCSGFTNWVAWLLNLPRSRSLAARSWLLVGTPVPLTHAIAAFDVVIFKRGPDPQPGPDVTSGANGHVAFFAGLEGDHVLVVGGNQGDAVSLGRFPMADVLGVRRLV